MSQPEQNSRIDYIEFPARDIEATKRFFGSVFGWEFEDWGPGYISFHDGRLSGGFTSEREAAPSGGPLVVFYAADLEDALRRVGAAGGAIVKPIFAFPGGRRFEFTDPNGNTLAVWSE